MPIYSVARIRKRDRAKTTKQKPNLFGLSDVGCRRARKNWGIDADGVWR